MEKVIKLETQHSYDTVKIEIDNSSEYKDFYVKWTSHKEDVFKEMSLSYSEHGLDINNRTLTGLEIELLKEFLSQH